MGVGHDAVPTAAGTAVLRVDVALELAHVVGLQSHGLHVVAGVVLERVELAELVVLDQEVDEDPLSTAPGAFEPLPVRALVGQRVGCRPVLERRPADRVMCADRRAGAGDVLQHGACALSLLVVGAVLEGSSDAVGVPRPPAVHVAAEELERHAVRVPVQIAAHFLVGGRAAEGLARDVHVDLGPRLATGPQRKREGCAGRGDGELAGRADREAPLHAREREDEGRPGRLHGPVGVLRRVGRSDDARWDEGPDESLARVPHQIAAEVGGLEVERLGCGRVRGGRGVLVPRTHDPLAVLGRLQCVATTGHRVLVLGHVRVRTQLGALRRHEIRVGLGPLLAHRVGVRERLGRRGGVLGLIGERCTGDRVLEVRGGLAVELLRPGDVRREGRHRHGESRHRHGDGPEMSVSPQVAHGAPLVARRSQRFTGDGGHGRQNGRPRALVELAP